MGACWLFERPPNLTWCGSEVWPPLHLWASLTGGGHWFEPCFEPLAGGGVSSPGAAPVPPYGLLLPGDELLGGVLLGPLKALCLVLVISENT
jgi:hypothetical protein